MPNETVEENEYREPIVGRNRFEMTSNKSRSPGFSKYLVNDNALFSVSGEQPGSVSHPLDLTEL